MNLEFEKNKCTILVNSCDKYEDTWHPFFYILKRQWKDIEKYPIVLNTESKRFSMVDLNIKCFSLYKEGESVPWGKRLKETLKHIDSEYIIFLLDDFFMLKEVDQGRIDECVEWMEQDKSIAVFSFWRTRGENIKDNKYKYFERRPQNGSYRLNCQAAIWRKKLLYKYIRNHESPWEWELLGSRRSKRYKEKFYSAVEGQPYVMEYDWFAGGGIHRGKWTKGVKDLFAEYGIECDFSIRGIEDLNCDNSNKVHAKSIFDKIENRLYLKWREFLSLI